MAPTGEGQTARWFDAWADVLALYARQWLTPAEAEDVVQDAFVRLLAAATPPDRPKAWLFRVVRNAALNRLRSARRRRRREQELAAERVAWFSASPEALIDAQVAQQALEALPAEQREIVVLRIWGELTFPAAAELIGVSTSTAFQRYRSALVSLRTRLERKPCPQTET